MEVSMFRQYRPITRGEFFVVGGDTSQGGGDYNSVQFLSKTKLDVPLVYHGQGVAAQLTSECFPVFEKLYDATGVKPVIALERQNGGASEMERLDAMNRLSKYKLFVFRVSGQVEATESNKLGWDTTSATRGDMLGDLKQCIDSKILRIYDEPTINEFYSFIRSYRAGKWQGEAEKNSHDDLIMSLAIAWQLYQTEMPPQTVTREDLPPPPQVHDSVIGI